MLEKDGDSGDIGNRGTPPPAALTPSIRELTPAYRADHTMTAGQVAELFHVNPKTVSRWASLGTLEAIRTPGGHRRFRRADALNLLAARRQITDNSR